MKTTKRHFEYFKKCCQKWIKYLGLLRYEVFFEHIKLDDARAMVRTKCIGKVSTIFFNTESDFVSNSMLNKVAFHECFELLLSRMASMMQGAISYYLDDIDEEIHTVIRTMENTLFEEVKNKI